ncbi:MAG: hypothetical protein ABL986_16410 [Vicinamibacterales bacterium]
MRRIVPLVIAAGVIYFLLPPSARVVSVPSSGPVRGVIHAHTLRSDGTGTVDDVARAAARAGLSFVIVTDHGDGTRAPDPPEYRSGVLYIDAVEISTDDGHVVAVGLPETPYPLGGEARDVVDDIHRLGGWAVAAHPGSPRPNLAWRDWNVPVDAVEWVNGDSEWRDESAWSLVRALLTYPFRPAESLVSLLDRPDPVISRWDQLATSRPVVALAAADAHARVGLTSLGEPYDSRASIPLPSYAAVFSAMSITLEGVSLSGDAAGDARTVENALRAGHVYSTIDGLAVRGQLEFTGMSGDRGARMGDRLAATGPVTLRASTSGPGDATMTLFRDGRAERTVQGTVLEEVVPADPAIYRVEVSLAAPGGAPRVPWMISNPIYVGAAPASTGVLPSGRPTPATTFSLEQLGATRIERSGASEAATTITRALDGRELLFRYALGGKASDHPYAAAVIALPVPVQRESQIRFSARADRPMRLSVQVRSPGPGDGDRWRRSIYLDETPRDFSVVLTDMRAVASARLDDRLATIDSLLFVVDDEHTRMGNGGRVWLRNLAIAK